MERIRVSYKLYRRFKWLFKFFGYHAMNSQEYAEEINKYIPKVYVAVLAAYEDEFKHWVKENKKPNEEYFRVVHPHSADGRMFSRIEYIKGWQRMQNAYECQEFTETLLKIYQKYAK